MDADRIPPPPPRTAEYGWDEDVDEQDPYGLAVETDATDFFLKVRCSMVSRTNTSNRPERLPPMQILHIHVHRNMSAELLGKCVSQAVSPYSGVHYDGQGNFPLLVGLFGENDRIFYSFEHIMSLHNPTCQTYCTMRYVPPSPPPPPPLWWKTPEFLLLLFVLLAFVVIHFHGDVVWNVTTGVSTEVFELVFSLPLRELYGKGPHLIGWEGLPMAEICNRITHYGGRDFWKQNTALCDEIYAGKEEAFIRIMRPLVYSIVGIVLFYLIKSLVVSYGESKRNRTDRAVIEAFHAFQTLVRIANRQPGPPRR